MSRGHESGRAGASRTGSTRGGRAGRSIGKSLDAKAYQAMLDNRSRQLNPEDETYESSRSEDDD